MDRCAAEDRAASVGISTTLQQQVDNAKVAKIGSTEERAQSRTVGKLNRNSFVIVER